MNATLAPTQTQPRLSTADALARLAKWRDPVAWAAILEQHGAGILRVAQRATGDAALCDDVCQETLLQIRAHAGSFSPQASSQDAETAARGWIMRIACRTAYKMVRSRERLSLRETRAAGTVSAAVSAMDTASLREESERVRRETMALPEAVREPLCLRFFGEMTFPELGVALGCSEEAAKKRVQRGLNVLRSRLVANGIAVSVAALTGALSQGSAHAAELPAAAAATTSTSGAASAASVINPQQLAAWQALLQSSGAPSLSGIVTFGGLTVMAKTVFSAAIVALFAISGFQALSIHGLQSETAQTRAAAEQASNNAGVFEKKLEESRAEIADLKAQLANQQKEAFALGNQLAELKKNAGSTQAQWPGVAAAGVPGKRVILGGQRNVNGVTIPEVGGAVGVQEFNIAIPPGGVPGPDIQIFTLPEETKKALKDAGVNVDDVLKNVKDQNTFQFVKDVDGPNGKMSVRVMKNGGVVTTTTHTNAQNPPPLPKQPGQKPPAPPDADPNANF